MIFCRREEVVPRAKIPLGVIDTTIFLRDPRGRVNLLALMFLFRLGAELKPAPQSPPPRDRHSYY
jgi:hypothetical protein